jgi:hypothetical protein
MYEISTSLPQPFSANVHGHDANETPLKIEGLGDHLGQYIITLTYSCGHRRRTLPRTLAGIAGWDAKLTDVVRRMRCFNCGKRIVATSG